MHIVNIKCLVKFSDFVVKAKQFFLIMMNQGENQVTLLKQVKKAMKQHPIAFKSFSVSIEKKYNQHTR